MPAQPQPRRIPPETPYFIWPTPDNRDVIIWMEKSADLASNKKWQLGEKYPDIIHYPNHKLIHVTAEDEDKWFKWYYMTERADQDEYNWSFTKADIGGTNFDAVERTYVTLRSEFDPDTPAMGDAMPDVPSGLFSGTYVLAKRSEQRGDKEMDGLFVAEKRTYVKKVPLVQNDYDEMFGGNLHSTQTLYYATEIVPTADANLDSDSDASTDPQPMTAAELFLDGENAFWGLQSDGLMRQGRQLTAEWYLITERQVVPTEFALHGRSFQSTVDYSWPGVLAGVHVDIWELRRGGSQNYTSPIWSKEAYKGPCKAQVVQRFYVDAPIVTQPNVMRSLPINVQNPFYGIHIGPTLHGAFNWTCSSGSNHPVFKYIVATYPCAETTPVDWPPSILEADTVHPFRGGFLRITTTAYPPVFTP